MDALRSDLTKRLEDSVSEKAKAIWGDLSELVKTEVKEALEDLANLTLMQLKATDEAEKLVLDMEMRHCRARIANWTFVGSNVVVQAVKDSLKELAEFLGSFLKGLIR